VGPVRYVVNVLVWSGVFITIAVLLMVVSQ
jgi:hypothetical protein